MSHTTEIADIVITDIEALKSAIGELNTKGIKCALVQNAKPRAFYENQEGMGIAPYIVQLNDGLYDVGLYRDEQKKGYVCRADLFGGYVGKFLGALPVTGESNNYQQAALGKLYSTYAVHATTRKAIQQGHSVKRVNAPDGSVRLVIGNIK